MELFYQFRHFRVQFQAIFQFLALKTISDIFDTIIRLIFFTIFTIFVDLKWDVYSQILIFFIIFYRQTSKTRTAGAKRTFWRRRARPRPSGRDCYGNKGTNSSLNGRSVTSSLPQITFSALKRARLKLRSTPYWWENSYSRYTAFFQSRSFVI